MSSKSILGLTLSSLVLCAASLDARSYIRGDVNADGRVDLDDALALLDCQVNERGCSPCESAADANADGRIDSIDVVTLVQASLGDSSASSTLAGNCIQAKTTDRLSCNEYPPCSGGKPPSGPNDFDSGVDPLCELEPSDPALAFDWAASIDGLSVDTLDEPLVPLSIINRTKLDLVLVPTLQLVFDGEKIVQELPASKASPGGFLGVVMDIDPYDHGAPPFEALRFSARAMVQVEAFTKDGKRIAHQYSPPIYFHSERAGTLLVYGEGARIHRFFGGDFRRSLSEKSRLFSIPGVDVVVGAVEKAGAPYEAGFSNETDEALTQKSLFTE